jgi:hypothetical protein
VGAKRSPGGSDDPRAALSAGAHGPDLSVILVTIDTYEAVRLTVRHLLAQTVLDHLELVLVVPSADTAALDGSELARFRWTQVVEVGDIAWSGEAKAAGTHVARADVVVFAEEHSYPAPDWAEALLRAHEDGWAAVGPVMLNGNGPGAVGWAGFLPDYIHAAGTRRAGAVSALPWHNTSYKRAVLLDYGADLGALLQVEGILHQDLQRKGYRLYLEPAARTTHLNISRFSSFARDQWHSGRTYGAARASYERWTAARRAFYIAIGPLIPAVRLGRVAREWKRVGTPVPPAVVARLLLALLTGLTLHTIGEMLGYAFGGGDAPRQKTRLEFHRNRHLNAADWHTWQAARRSPG